MQRTIVVILAALCVAAPAFAQRNPSGTAARAVHERPQPLPVAQIPIERDPRGLPTMLGEEGLRSEPLTSAEILQRISRIYDYQARMLAAVAREDRDAAGRLLDLAMTEVSTLARQEGVMERPRFQQMYRSVLTEYERFYGVSSDTLSLPFGDIFQFRADMFAALDAVDEPLLEDVMTAEVGHVATVFPMTMNRLVEQSIAYLLRSPEKHLYHWLSRAETYFPMVEQIFREENVPDELKYLAMIESGLNPRARSWAQAGGMWQFITATGRAYGLETNSWVDERLDPEKATRAAGRHLRDLYELFDGDWQLALAGYNCSPSRIKRAIRRAEARLGRRATFWDIYDDIPRETRNYVPMFIAAALVASNPEAYDVDLSRVKPGPTYAYHYVPVRGMLAVDDIADMAGTDEATIRALNPELRRNMLPPAKGAYFVRIPLGSYDAFAEAFEALPAEKKRTTVLEHTVQRGDALGIIARRYGVTVSELMSSNGLRSTTIHPGQRLVVPVPAYDRGVELASLEKAEAVTVRYGKASVRPIQVAQASTPRRERSRVETPSTPVVQANYANASRRGAAEKAENKTEQRPAENRAETEKAKAPERDTRETRIVYTVRRGDTLGKIAGRYGVTVSDLRRWNDIRGSRIQVGQRVLLYESESGGTAKAGSSSGSNKVVYKVRRGDTLSGIASRYGVSVRDLRRWNNISGSRIRSGQRLDIHAGNAPSVISYRVQRGDTLIEIARRYGVSVRDLKEWNALRSSTIRTGQRLEIRS